MSAIDLPRARRLAFGVVLGQAVVSVIVAAGALAIAGRQAAVSALLGGGIATAGSLAMAALAFSGARGSGGSAQRAAGAFYVGEAVKLAVVVVLFVAVLKMVRVVPLALFAGFAATYLVYWIALVSVLPAAGGARRGV
ncbi:MAG: ATP synthase subunit I [Steroidobacteraceae bacterium]